MKRILLTVALVLIAAAPLFAQTSTLQMKLAKDAGFIDRVSFSLVQQAHVVKLNGAGETTACSGQVVNCHALRSAYAANIINSPASFAAVVAVSLVGQVNLLSGVVTTCSGTPMVCTTDATDAAIISQIATLWNALSGVL